MKRKINEYKMNKEFTLRHLVQFNSKQHFTDNVQSSTHKLTTAASPTIHNSITTMLLGQLKPLIYIIIYYWMVCTQSKKKTR
jgi:hypothetical protein